MSVFLGACPKIPCLAGSGKYRAGWSLTNHKKGRDDNRAGVNNGSTRGTPAVPLEGDSNCVKRNGKHRNEVPWKCSESPRFGSPNASCPRNGHPRRSPNCIAFPIWSRVNETRDQAVRRGGQHAAPCRAACGLRFCGPTACPIYLLGSTNGRVPLYRGVFVCVYMCMCLCV